MIVESPTSPTGCQQHRSWRCRRGFRRTLWACLVAAVSLLPSHGQEVVQVVPQPATVDVNKEYNVKGVYVFNFARYVTWPQKAAVPSGEFRIGILGQSLISQPLTKLAGRKQIQDRHTGKKLPLRIRQFKTLDDYQPCHILFIPRTVTAEQRKAIAKRFANQPVLLVGESTNFARGEGTAGFVMMNGGIRFDLNLADAKQKNLKLDAKLLKAANSILEKIDQTTLSTK